MRLLPLTLLLMVCHAVESQPPEIRTMAERLVPEVNIHGDEEFFAAWNLDYAGLEAVKAAVEAGDYAKAKVALKEYFLARRKPKWRTNHWQMPAKPRGKPEDHSKYKQGQDVLGHRFRGHQFGDRIDWNCYPRKRPDGSPDTEYTPSPVDFRHAPQVLGQLYWFSHDERYAKEFVAEITDFITTWPPPEKYRGRKSPGCWSRLRAVGPVCGVWQDAYNMFLPSKHFTPEAHAIMLESFIEKARYAVRNPGRVNRYLVQLRGIYSVGCYFPELRQAEGFRDLAVAAMLAGIEEELYPDTSSKEACPGYQGMYVSALYGMVEGAHTMGYEAPAKLREAFEHCSDLYVRLVTPLHKLPQFGDTGSNPRLAKIFRLNVTPFIDKPEYHWMASRGEKGRPPDYTSIRLPYAGFYVMRSGWDKRSFYLCFDAGPLGKGHWHEDFGNFECFAYGERLIADMGVYSYVFSQWRQYFVSSLAHNVVLVAGQEEPVPRGWHTPGKFDKQPAPVAIFEQKATDRVHYDTVLFPLDVGEKANVRVERLPVIDKAGAIVPAAQVCALRVVTGDGMDYYVNDLRQREIGPANDRAKTAGPLKTDARAAAVRLDANGKLLRASAVGGSQVMLDEQIVWQP